MSMSLTTYAYPWDVAWLGADVVVDELHRHGFDAIDLAATYHPIDALSPRDGMRLFTSPRGAVHFPARPRRYGRIQPSVVPDPTIPGAWRDLTRAARARGLLVNAWAVVLFQPWIVDAFPDCARTLPSGDAIGSGVCPASPDVQEYVAALVADVSDQFELAALRLEGVTIPELDYGWLRPRVLVRLAPLARELLGICFCPSCRARGADAGLDVERIRAVVVGALARLDDPAAEDAVVVSELEGDAELGAFVAQHHHAAVDLVRAVAAVTGPAGVRLSANVDLSAGPVGASAATDAVVAILELLDTVRVLPWSRPDETATIAELVSRSRGSVGLAALLAPVDLTALIAPPGAAGPRSTRPTSGDGIVDEINAALAVGAREITLYNYGLLRDRDVERFALAVARARSS